MNSRWNGQFLGSFWSREKEEQKAGQREKEVNKKRKSTSETPQRPDVATSRRQRNFYLNIIKIKGTRNRGGSIRKRMDEGTDSIAAATQISGEDTCFCIFFFSNKLLMVYRLITCIIKSLYLSIICDLLVSALYL